MTKKTLSPEQLEEVKSLINDINDQNRQDRLFCLTRLHYLLRDTEYKAEFEKITENSYKTILINTSGAKA